MIENAPTTGGIYIIENTISGRKYIGKTRNFRERWLNHYSLLQRGKHKNEGMQKDWNPETFTFTIHCEIENPTDRHLKEAEMVLLNSHSYNLRPVKKEFEAPAPYGKAVMENLEKLRTKGFI